ncbi:MAG: hypothetical protein ACJ72Z_01045 [Pyrinomonadaceae bacterium]
MQQQENRKHDDLQSGHDLPNSDGTVSDEDVKAIDGPDGRLKGGKDHSLDNYADTTPDDGVGGVQRRSDTTSDIADISD